MEFKVSSIFCVVVVFLIQTENVACQNNVASLMNAANQTYQMNLRQGRQAITQFYNSLNTLTTRIQNQVLGILNTIDARILDEAIALGGLPADVATCIQMQTPRRDALVASAVQNLTGCVLEPINQGITDVANIYDALGNLSNIVLGIGNRVTNSCGQPPNPQTLLSQPINPYTVCFEQQAFAILLQILQQDLILATNVADLAGLVSSIQSFPMMFSACIATRTAVIFTNALPLIGDIVQCAIAQQLNK